MANFSYFEGTQTSVPGGTGYVYFTLSPGSGNQWVSLGFQNIGFAVDLYVSQMFISTGGLGHIQVVNTSLSSTNAVPYGVYAPSSGPADVSGSKPTVKVEKGTKKK